MPARLYRPLNAAKPAPGLIVFFHQGGFVGGSLDECDEFARALALRAGLPVLASSYTLACQQPFPAAVEDAYAVLRGRHGARSQLGWSGERLLCAGIEAGGNLAAVCGADGARPRRAGAGRPDPDHAHAGPRPDHLLDARDASSNPDIAGVADACAAGYRGYLPQVADRMHPYASPLQSSRLKGLPPALILSAEEDPLCDEAEQYGARLARPEPVPRCAACRRCRCTTASPVATAPVNKPRWKKLPHLSAPCAARHRR